MEGRTYLVIHNDENAKTNVGVIIEAKKPTNLAEMPQSGKDQMQGTLGVDIILLKRAYHAQEPGVEIRFTSL